MALCVKSYQVSVSRGDIREFELSGLCESDDLNLLMRLIDESGGLLELFKQVAACEWCGSLYPKKELRCRRGCGGPRT